MSVTPSSTAAMPSEARLPPVLLAGGIEGDDPLESARRMIGLTASTGCVPLIETRTEDPWLLLRTADILADSSIDYQPYGPRLLSGRTRLSEQQAELFRGTLEAFALGMDLEAPPSEDGSRPTVTAAVAGPVTLAASLYDQSGRRLVADPGGLRFLAEALAHGAVAYRERVRRDHGLNLEFILVEDRLDAAASGSIPTASGWTRHRPLTREAVHAALRCWNEVVYSASRGGLGSAVVGIGDVETARSALAVTGTRSLSLSPRLTQSPGSGGFTPSDVERAHPVLDDAHGILFDVGEDVGAQLGRVESAARAVETAGVEDSARHRIGLWIPAGWSESPTQLAGRLHGVQPG